MHQRRWRPLSVCDVAGGGECPARAACCAETSVDSTTEATDAAVIQRMTAPGARLLSNARFGRSMPHGTFPPALQLVRTVTMGKLDSAGRVPESPPPGSAPDRLGNRQALDAMLPEVYAELRALAARYLRREGGGHTLQPTALVHEAFLRLVDQRKVDWTNRAQLLGIAAEMMRRILVNYARDRAAVKRGGGAQRVSLSIVEDSLRQGDVDMLMLHEALENLEQMDARKGRVVELKYFGGLTTDEIAEVLGISGATVEREWKFARAWLYDAMRGSEPNDSPSAEP